MPTRQELIHNWRISKNRLAIAKKAEMEWRVACCAMFFPDPVLGTNTSDDGSLKLVISETITLEKDELIIDTAMTQIVKLFPNELQTFALMLEKEYKLNKAAFNALSIDAQDALSAIITIKKAAPKLTYSGDDDD